jgi:hypothetical protein
LDGGAVDLREQGHDLNRRQEMDEVIQQRPFVQPLHAVHQLLPIQPPSNPRIIAPGDLPTQPLRQVRGDLVVRLCHAQPPSVQCFIAREESGPQIKSFAHVGISEKTALLSVFDLPNRVIRDAVCGLCVSTVGVEMRIKTPAAIEAAEGSSH